MEKTPYVGPFLRIIASVYDFFLLLGVWFLVGSLALWLNGGEILNPVLGSLLVFLSGWAFYAFFWMLMIFALNLTIYTVFDQESESEVKKHRFLDPGGKNQEIRIS